MFDRAFLSAVRNGSREALLQILRKETPGTEVYSFPFLTPAFCAQLLQEVEHLEGYSPPAPNSMNRYGVVLDQFGFQAMTAELIRTYVRPLTSLLFPHYGGDRLDHHHSFVVRYRLDEDRDLDIHMDQSEVTLNVNLGRTFTGGALLFHGMRDHPSERQENVSVPHALGTAVLHVGQHWHGAAPLQSGERYNWIIWCRSTEFHASPAEQFLSRCPLCGEESAEEFADEL